MKPYMPEGYLNKIGTRSPSRSSDAGKLSGLTKMVDNKHKKDVEMPAQNIIVPVAIFFDSGMYFEAV